MEDAKLLRGKLFAAAWRGDFDGVKCVLNNNNKLDVNVQDENGVSALRFAAQFGHLDIVKYLLDSGADPNLRAHDKLDPLLAATETGNQEIVQLLINSGANVETHTGLTSAVYLAQQKGHLELVDLLVQNGAPKEMSKWWKFKKGAKQHMAAIKQHF